jgi:outer membrane biosynthesis protein TonB
VFDNIGKDLDEEANKRRASALFLTLSVLGAVVGLTVGVGAYMAAEVVLDVDLDKELVDLIEETVNEALPPPPPPPPPPPAAAAEEEQEEPETPQPDEMVEEIKELEEEVKEEVKSDVKPAGVEGGQEGGQVGGVVGGVQGGIEGGVLGGQLSGVRVFHHSELEVKKRINPEYPEAARALQIGDQRCLAKVFIDEEGVPYDVIVETCPKVFHDDTKAAILKWRWYPPKDGKNRVKAQTTIAVTYKLN